MAWNYQRTESTQFAEIPEGRYRALIDSAEKAVSRSGNDMLVIKMKVSGQTSSIWYYISFLEDRPEITNRMLTQLFDSFGIEEGNFNLMSYVGKAGGICVKHDDTGRARISYLLSKKQQEELPPYVGDPVKAPPKVNENGFMEIPEGEDDEILF